MDELREAAFKHMREEVWSKYKSVKAEKHRLPYELQREIEHTHAVTVLKSEYDELAAIDREKLEEDVIRLEKELEEAKRKLRDRDHKAQRLLERTFMEGPKVWDGFFTTCKRARKND